MVQAIIAEAEIGKIYKGTVRKIVEFGAFVEIMPGTDGLVHISQLAPGRVNKVTDVLKEGDEVMVKVLEIDRQGKIRLSRKEALQEAGSRFGRALSVIRARLPIPCLPRLSSITAFASSPMRCMIIVR
jgi:polyribonucleotide nucleotidyltransferase